MSFKCDRFKLSVHKQRWCQLIILNNFLGMYMYKCRWECRSNHLFPEGGTEQTRTAPASNGNKSSRSTITKRKKKQQQQQRLINTTTTKTRTRQRKLKQWQAKCIELPTIFHSRQVWLNNEPPKRMSNQDWRQVHFFPDKISYIAHMHLLHRVLASLYTQKKKRKPTEVHLVPEECLQMNSLLEHHFHPKTKKT